MPHHDVGGILETVHPTMAFSVIATFQNIHCKTYIMCMPFSGTLIPWRMFFKITYIRIFDKNFPDQRMYTMHIIILMTSNGYVLPCFLCLPKTLVLAPKYYQWY